jgi:hypothetical protein
LLISQTASLPRAAAGRCLLLGRLPSVVALPLSRSRSTPLSIGISLSQLRRVRLTRLLTVLARILSLLTLPLSTRLPLLLLACLVLRALRLTILRPSILGLTILRLPVLRPPVLPLAVLGLVRLGLTILRLAALRLL